MGIIEYIKALTSKVEQREIDMSTAYTKGVRDATDKQAIHIRDLTNSIERIVKDTTAKLEDRETYMLDHESQLRQEYNNRIKDLEEKFTQRCFSCKQVTESEIDRFRKMQLAMSEKLEIADRIFRKLYSHAGMVADEQDNILRATGKLSVSRDKLLTIRSEIDMLRESSNNLLQTIEFTVEEERKK